MPEPVEYDLEQRILRFNFTPLTPESSYPVKVKRNTDTGSSLELSWQMGYASMSPNHNFHEHYSVALNLGDQNLPLNKDGGNGVISGSSTDPNMTWDVIVTITKTADGYQSDGDVIPFTLFLHTLGVDLQPKSLTIRFAIQASDNNAENPFLIYKVVGCSRPESAKDDALIPCPESNRPTECKKLKYFAVDTGGNDCPGYPNSGPSESPSAYQINLKIKPTNNGVDPPECYQFQPITDRGILRGLGLDTKEGITDKCCHNSSANEECSTDPSNFVMFDSCASCTNDYGKSLVLKEAAIAYLLAHGWVADLGGIVVDEIKSPSNYDDGGDTQFFYTRVSAVADSKTIERNLLPIGGYTSKKTYNRSINFSNLLGDPKNQGIARSGGKVKMDPVYFKYSVQQASSQSAMLLEKWRAKFIFDLKQNVAVFRDGNESPEIELKEIKDVELKKAWIDYLYKNSTSREMEIDIGKHFSIGADFFTETSSRISGNKEIGKKQERMAGVRVYFKVEDVISLLGKSINDTEFFKEAKDSLTVEIYANGKTKDVKISEFNSMIDKIISMKVDDESPILGAFYHLRQTIKELKLHHTVLTGMKINYEFHRMNGSSLRIFSERESPCICSGLEGVEEVDNMIRGISIKLASLDGAVISLVHKSPSGEYELGINYTRKFSEINHGAFSHFSHIGRSLFGTDVDGEVSFFSGMTMIDRVDTPVKKSIDKQYSFNVGLSLKGTLGKRTNLNQDEVYKRFMSGFSYDVGASLQRGIWGNLNWSKTVELFKYKSGGFTAEMSYTLDADLDGAFKDSNFSVDIDLKYQHTLVEFGSFLGTVQASLYANGQFKLRDRQGGINRLFSLRFQYGAEIKWENEVFSYLGFWFDIHPKLGFSGGLSFVGATDLLMEGIKSRRSKPQTLFTIPLGYISFDVVDVDPFRQALMRQHHSWLASLGESIQEWNIPVLSWFIGGIIRWIGTRVPVLSRIGPRESVFSYLSRTNFIKSYMEFVKAALECEDEIVKNLERSFSGEGARLKEFFLDLESVSTKNAIQQEKFQEFLNLFSRPNLIATPEAIEYSQRQTLVGKLIRDYKEDKSSPLDLQDYLNDADKNRVPGKRFIDIYNYNKGLYKEEKKNQALKDAYKNPLDCDCIFTKYKSCDEKSKILFERMGQFFPQLFGNLGIIEIFFTKISNAYFEILFEQLKTGRLQYQTEKQVERNIKTITFDFLSNKRAYILEELKKKIFLSTFSTDQQKLPLFQSEIPAGSTAQYEKGIFSKIDKEYDKFLTYKGDALDTVFKDNINFYDKMTAWGGRTYMPAEILELLDPTPKELGTVIRSCYILNGPNNYAKSILYEWIIFSKKIGDSMDIVDANNNVIFESIDNGGRRINRLGNKRNITESSWVNYLANLFPLDDQNFLPIDQKCPCSKPYPSFWKDYSKVNFKMLRDRVLVVKGDNEAFIKDIDKGIRILSYLVRHDTSAYNQGLGSVLESTTPNPEGSSNIPQVNIQSLLDLNKYYHNCSTSDLKAEKSRDGTREITYKGKVFYDKIKPFDEQNPPYLSLDGNNDSHNARGEAIASIILGNFSSIGIKLRAGVALNILLLRKKIIEDVNTLDLFDWFAFYLMSGNNNVDRDGPFSNFSGFKYFNIYTETEIQMTQHLNSLVGIETIWAKLWHLLNKVAFTNVGFQTTEDFKVFFYNVILRIQELYKDLKTFETKFSPPINLQSVVEKDSLKFSQDARVAVILLMKRDLKLFIEIFKQVVEIQLQRATQSGDYLSDIIRKVHEDRPRGDFKYKSIISDKIKELLLRPGEDSFDLEFLFVPDRLEESLISDNPPRSRDPIKHKEINDEIGIHYYLWSLKSDFSDVAPKLQLDVPKDPIKISSSKNSCGGEKGMVRYYSKINSPHRSQFSIGADSADPGFYHAPYNSITRLHSPYVYYYVPDSTFYNRASNFRGTNHVTCGIILLNGIHGEKNLNQE